MRIIFCLLCLALALTSCKGEETPAQKEAQKKQTEKPAEDPTQKAMKEGY